MKHLILNRKRDTTTLNLTTALVFGLSQAVECTVIYVGYFSYRNEYISIMFTYCTL